MKPKHTPPAWSLRRAWGGAVLEVDGELIGRSTITREAEAAGVPVKTVRQRLARGDRTRERLFRPVKHIKTGRRVAAADEVREALAALDSRPRQWTGY